MQRSNTYILIFTIVLTIVCAGLLAGVSVALKPEHDKQIELDTKSQILGAVMDVTNVQDILGTYDKRVESIVVDYKGNVIEGKNAEDINALSEFKKKKVEEKLFPVYKVKSEVDENEVQAYVLPMYGNGLWDLIWGFVALGPDLNEVEGAVFDHKGETPGLGARITNSAENTGGSDDFQNRFQGKEIFDESGNLVGVKVLKGEGHSIPESDKHDIDGLSGATMTTSGLNRMIESYLGYYSNFIAKEKKNVKTSSPSKGDSNAGIELDINNSKGE